MKRPYVLSIAGFDPSGGAGLLADAKTMEANKVMGLGVASAITYQNEDKFAGLDWIGLPSMIRQMDSLFEIYPIKTVKVGLIENMEVLSQIVDYLIYKNNNIRIIWDPILRASAGFVFHSSVEKNQLKLICAKVFMITPNWEEIQSLYPEEKPEEGAVNLARYCKVFLKGGHSEGGIGKDFLYEQNQRSSYRPRQISPFAKHGSGCVFSAALAAFIARGFPLKKAILKAKQYVTWFLLSNETLLGYHK